MLLVEFQSETGNFIKAKFLLMFMTPLFLPLSYTLRIALLWVKREKLKSIFLSSIQIECYSFIFYLIL